MKAETPCDARNPAIIRDVAEKYGETVLHEARKNANAVPIAHDRSFLISNEKKFLLEVDDSGIVLHLSIIMLGPHEIRGLPNPQITTEPRKRIEPPSRIITGARRVEKLKTHTYKLGLSK
ncbi:hypothetical protein KIN20_028823 [Parelaphostrongylus tenuis]|uniref:Uncharacterized protein n=1 Tax=Parelaphostrongylus tenuis TaxID=148309 RepID=A0AAD5R1P7_PARTN|nr:hypothetical protein KIN20_028823 [Parelaphostrongylus tenuis]